MLYSHTYSRTHIALRAIAYILGTIVLAGIVGYLLWRVPEWYFSAWSMDLKSADLLKLQNELRLTMVQAFGGAALLAGLFFTWRNMRVAESNLRVAQETTSQNMELARAGQITERFSRAIEQLGSEKLAVRLGAIYALERVAKDSVPDHWPVMEVLTAVIHQNSPWTAASSKLRRETVMDIPTDIQSILTVFGRRTRGVEREDSITQRLTLIDADLRAASLFDTHMEDAILFGVHLEKAILVCGHFDGANLLDTHLEGADLEEASFEGAKLAGAHLKKARLKGTNMRNANLKNAHLEGTDLRLAVNLTWEQVREANVDNETRFPPEVEAELKRQTASTP